MGRRLLCNHFNQESDRGSAEGAISHGAVDGPCQGGAGRASTQYLGLVSGPAVDPQRINQGPPPALFPSVRGRTPLRWDCVCSRTSQGLLVSGAAILPSRH